jgi:hypothetical protein
MAKITTGPELLDDTTVSFTLQFADHAQQFHITREALHRMASEVDAANVDLIAFFRTHVDKIVSMAEQKYGKATQGVVVIGTAELS